MGMTRGDTPPNDMADAAPAAAVPRTVPTMRLVFSQDTPKQRSCRHPRAQRGRCARRFCAWVGGWAGR